MMDVAKIAVAKPARQKGLIRDLAVEEPTQKEALSRRFVDVWQRGCASLIRGKIVFAEDGQGVETACGIHEMRDRLIDF